MALRPGAALSNFRGLTASRVGRGFGSSFTLRGVDLAIGPGEIVGLVGPNGAGKTTLLQCLVGLLRMDTGTVTIDGHDVVREHAEAMRALGFVPETPRPIPNLTPAEHLLYTARAFNLPEGWRTRAGHVLQTLDLWDLRDRLAQELSKGQKQKIHLAMVMLRDPALVILDEPLIGLDPKAAFTLKEWVRARARAGGSALVSSHSLGFVEELSTRVMVLDGGSVVASGTIAELRDRTRLAAGTPFEQVFLKITAN
jgi:ABC-type multidrug transport system ATPase subunit